MNFNQFGYLIPLLVIFIVFVFILIRMEKKFFEFIRLYWFYRRSTLSYLSTFLYLLGMGGLLLSLLDLRGAEEKIKTPAPTERTIILIDTSASMLAEDVKPSRLKKAVLIAKHFARKAVGHQLSIIAFAEIHKKIVPFTNDLDLIDARLESLENLRNHYGSSALSVAIQESVQYFKEIDSDIKGNIVVVTDGEETSEGIELKIPKNIKVALVGVGTPNGGKIPLDDGRGFRIDYKRERGKEVITKLNENFFKTLASESSGIRYWITSSYSLPSDDIINFFRGENAATGEEQDMIIRPVMMEWIVVPSLIFLLVSYFLKSIRIFTLGIFFVLSPVFSQETEVKLSPETSLKLDKLQTGKLSRYEKIKLADELYKSGIKEEAITLYEENLPDNLDPEIPPEAYLNYGTTLIDKGDIKKALSVYQRLSSSLDKTERSRKIQDMMNKNALSFFKLQEKKKKEQEEKDKQSKDSENKDQSKDSKDNKDQDGTGKQENQKKQGPGSDSGEEEKNKNEPSNNGEEQNKDNDSDQKNDTDPKNQESKPLPPKKVPAKLKQLMSDDRQLQMKRIENGTRDLNRVKSRKSKDW
jgi:Ca-activated chloride channel family protein